MWHLPGTFQVPEEAGEQGPFPGSLDDPPGKLHNEAQCYGRDASDHMVGYIIIPIGPCCIASRHVSLESPECARYTSQPLHSPLQLLHCPPNSGTSWPTCTLLPRSARLPGTRRCSRTSLHSCAQSLDSTPCPCSPTQEPQVSMGVFSMDPYSGTSDIPMSNQRERWGH